MGMSPKDLLNLNNNDDVTFLSGLFFVSLVFLLLSHIVISDIGFVVADVNILTSFDVFLFTHKLA